MNNKIFLFSMAALAGAVAFAGCSDDETATSAATTTTSTGGGNGGNGGDGGMGGGGGGMPQLPTLGTQIDRMGRPAINTAANKTFTPDAERAAAEDAWNQNANPADWAGDHTADVAATIAILDSLDEVCGNQLGSCDDGSAGCYDFLAGVLVDDRLHVNATGTTCDIYLGVEANAVNALPNMDCGGRTPQHDVIERSYSLLSGVGLAGFDDTITAGAAQGVESFPFLQTSN